jgi:adenylosuccinate lyase
VTATVAEWSPDLDALAVAAEDAGNVVPALVAELRSLLDASTAKSVHRGLTSQDVLDSALMLMAKRVLTQVSDDLSGTADSLASLARMHRDDVMTGRTLTQPAAPITFGLKAAHWLSSVLDATGATQRVLDAIPVQCGGAVGTLALTGQVTSQLTGASQAFADALELVCPDVPWQTARSPITRVGDALVQSCDAVGYLASDIAVLARPEIGEVSEGASPGRGGSSTLPHKHNPVLTVLIRSAALQAPALGAQLHVAAASMTDERPAGPWHVEAPTLRRLMQLTATATAQTRELIAGLKVNVDAMAARAQVLADELLAEQFGSVDAVPADASVKGYLGESGAFVDLVLGRWEASRRG